MRSACRKEKSEEKFFAFERRDERVFVERRLVEPGRGKEEPSLLASLGITSAGKTLI